MSNPHPHRRDCSVMSWQFLTPYIDKTSLTSGGPVVKSNLPIIPSLCLSFSLGDRRIHEDTGSRAGHSTDRALHSGSPEYLGSVRQISRHLLSIGLLPSRVGRLLLIWLSIIPAVAVGERMGCLPKLWRGFTMRSYLAVVI